MGLVNHGLACAIIVLTRELCSRRSHARTSNGARKVRDTEDPLTADLNPAIARVLGNLDAVRNMLDGMESPHPALRHALDPLLVAFLRGEFGGN